MQAAVRSGSAEDATRLARLRWQSRSETERNQEDYEHFEQRFVAWLELGLASGQWHVAVASERERLVGCMFLRLVDTVPVPGIARRSWGYVTHAFVVSELRRQGIGRQLLDRLVAQATELGLHELHVWPSRDAITLYTRRGFRSPEAQRNASPPDEPSYVLRLLGD